MRLAGRVVSCIGVVLLLLSCLLVPSYAASPSCGTAAYWRAEFQPLSAFDGQFPYLYGWYNNGDWVFAEYGSVVPPDGVSTTTQFSITSIPKISVSGVGDDLSAYYSYTRLRMINTLSGVGPFVSYEYTVKFTSAVGYPTDWTDIDVKFYGSDGMQKDVAMVTSYDTSSKEMKCVFYGGDGFSPSYVSVYMPDRFTNTPNDLYITQSLSIVENTDVDMAMAAVYEQLGDINLKLDEGLANDDRLYDYLQETLNGSANLDSSSLDEGKTAIDDIENLENQIHDAMGTASLDFEQLEDGWSEYDVDIWGFSNAGSFFSDIVTRLFEYFGVLPFFALTLGLIMTVIGR